MNYVIDRSPRSGKDQTFVVSGVKVEGASQKILNLRLEFILISQNHSFSNLPV